MARIQQQNEGSSGPAKPTLEQLKRDLVDRCLQAGMDTGFARYFWTEVCSPYRRQYESPHPVAVQGAQNQLRWVEPYRERLMQCLDIYLAMSNADRQILHHGVDDGVKWRGEHMPQYQDICNETIVMREIGREDYVEQTQARLKELKL